MSDTELNENEKQFKRYLNEFAESHGKCRDGLKEFISELSTIDNTQTALLVELFFAMLRMQERTHELLYNTARYNFIKDLLDKGGEEEMNHEISNSN